MRVLSATNADLPREIAAGRFREDLLYRLNTVVIHLPPLRERREDIGPLAAHFLAHYAARYRKPLAGFDAGRHGGAGRAPLAGQRARAGAQHRARGADGGSRPRRRSRRGTSACRRARRPSRGAEEMSLEEAERVFIEKVLARHGGDVRLAAEQLGMSRSALYRRLQQYGVRE